MATFNNGESGLSVRTKINNVLQHADGTASELVINEAGADVNFRVESDTNANALFVDGGTGNVGIGTSSPAFPLEVRTASGGRVRFGDGTNNLDFFPTTGQISTGGDVLLKAFSASGIVSFSTGIGAPERMRVDSSGSVLVGTTALPLSQGFAVLQYGGGTYTRIAHNTAAGNSDAFIQFYRDGAQIGAVNQSGTSAVAFVTSSDYRLKEDVQPMVGASDRVLALNPVNFAWKVDGSRTDGFIAHEAQAVAPYAVTGEKDGEEMQGMDHSKLVPLLTAALQEALKRIEALEAQLNP